MSFKKLFLNLLTLICFTIVSELICITPVAAVTHDFQWTGLMGYSVKGKYSYDEATTARIISEQGAGQTNQLKSLTVNFYNPSGEIIYQFSNVTDSKSQGNYFEFNLDTTTRELVGNIDLGGEQPGELFLKGTVEDQISLIEIDPSGKEQLLDTD